MADKIRKSEAEWREELDETTYQVARRKGTERAFTGAYWDCHEDGVYRCACCGEVLFDAADKFDSGTGWPSFTRPAAEGAVETDMDNSYGMIRTEVTCARCDAHLGHLFPDGPQPTGQRYCINSVSLRLDKDEK